MKRLCKFLLVPVMMLSLILSGCGTSDTSPTNEPKQTTAVQTTTVQTAPTEPELIQSKPVKLLWRKSREIDDTIGAEVKKYIEENSGVEFEMLNIVAYDEFDTRINIALASQDDIDAVLLRNASAYTNISNNGALMRLNDLLPEYAPNLLNLYSEEEWRATTYKNGNIYAIPKTAARWGELLSVRKDWMEKLGISSISTMDEFEAYLRALKDADFDGNGVKDTCTLLTSGGFGPLENSLYYIFTESYPVISVNGVYVDPAGKITPSGLHPQYKDYLAKMRQWYAEGLLHPDTYTIAKAQVEDLVVANKVGALAAWYTDHLRSWETLSETVPEAEYIHIAPKTVNGNPYALVSPAPAGPHIGIVSYSKNEAFVLKLLDWMAASEENYFTARMGLQGKDWEWADRERGLYTDLKNDSQGTERYWFHYNILNYVKWDFRADNLTFNNEKTYASQDFQNTLDIVVKPDWYVTYDWKGTPVENTQADARTMLEEAVTKIILGQIPLEDWDKTTEEYRKLFANDFIELATQTFNEYK